MNKPINIQIEINKINSLIDKLSNAKKPELVKSMINDYIPFMEHFAKENQHQYSFELFEYDENNNRIVLRPMSMDEFIDLMKSVLI